jgi:hypothetical protein
MRDLRQVKVSNAKHRTFVNAIVVSLLLLLLPASSSLPHDVSVAAVHMRAALFCARPSRCGS